MERILHQEQAYLAGQREAEIEELRNDVAYHEWLTMLHEESIAAQEREAQG